MFDGRKLFSGKRKYFCGLLLLSFVALICAAFGMTDNDGFDSARREVLLRKIGDELLLRSGDAQSRVLPIKKISDDEYRINFENGLSFEPEFLVNTTRRLLAKDPRAGDYTVNVLNCGDSSVAYAFAISKNTKDDIVACIGRRQPKARYAISVKFKPTGVRASSGYLLASLPFLAVFGFLVLRSAKPRNPLPDTTETDVLTFGATSFDVKNRKLTTNQKTTDLTRTETRLLLIFAMSPNRIVERSRLQKEIWQDEGVIVGRSLDMFISKLRKKLEPDPTVNIVVVRGKGYTLETGISKNV